MFIYEIMFVQRLDNQSTKIHQEKHVTDCTANKPCDQILSFFHFYLTTYKLAK
jgi:hypothetical protein